MAYYETEILNNGSEGSTVTYNQSNRSNSNASSAISFAEANNNLYNYIPTRNRNYVKQLQNIRNRNLEVLNNEKQNLNNILKRAKRRRNAIRILEDPVRLAKLKAAAVPEVASEPIERVDKRKEEVATPKKGILSKVIGLFTRKGGRRGRRTYRRRK